MSFWVFGFLTMLDEVLIFVLFIFSNFFLEVENLEELYEKLTFTFRRSQFNNYFLKISFKTQLEQ